ncbi:GDP-mannose 4,6-dehydratase [soil metagenome]
MKKILITGITGFAGQYLAEELLSTPDIELHGTYHSDEGLKRLGDLQRKIILHKADLTQKEIVNQLIQESLPDEIYSLAAQTSPSESIKDPAKTLTVNILSQLYLFQAIKEIVPKARILAVSSGDIYGAVESSDLPVDEQTSLRPANPYAVSKVTQDFLALEFFLADELSVIRARPFNHMGPRQQPKFVVPMFAKQIADIEKGQQEPVVKVGNLQSRKDFTDVRDIVKAYRLLIEKGISGEVYNIGSGRSVEIQQILDILLSFSEVKITVQVDKGLFRTIDTPDIYCDSSKLEKLTGWKPEITLEKTLKDTLDYFRSVV